MDRKPLDDDDDSAKKLAENAAQVIEGLVSMFASTPEEAIPDVATMLNRGLVAQFMEGRDQYEKDEDWADGMVRLIVSAALMLFVERRANLHV